MSLQARELHSNFSSLALRANKTSVNKAKQMSDGQPPKRRRRSLSISRRRALSRGTTGTKLWVADEPVFNEFVRRRGTTSAELLRDIVHDWAITKRVSGQATDTLELAGPIRKLHQVILAEQLTPVHAALATIIDTLNTRSFPVNSTTAFATTDNQDSALLAILKRLSDELETSKKELAKLRAFAAAHFMLAGQTFAAAWATLDFFLRYIAEPTLRNDPNHSQDSFEASVTYREYARKEGLLMVEQMSFAFQYPEEYTPVLFCPVEDQE
jgi:hypothetical protein